jgi:hypothetical protein
MGAVGGDVRVGLLRRFEKSAFLAVFPARPLKQKG